MDDETTGTNEEARTVGEMSTDEFFGGIGAAFASALDQAGAGQPAGAPVTTPASPEVPARVDPAYGQAARVRFGFERSAEIRNLPTQEARDARVDEYLECHDWMVALTVGDRQRAAQIAANSLGMTEEHYRVLSTGAGGAALVPTILEGPIIEKKALMDKLTPLAVPHRSSSGTLDLSAEGVVMVGVGTAELSPVDVTDTDYDPISLRLKKATAGVVASREQMFDTAASMQLVQNFSSQAGRAFATYNNTQNITGDGTGTNYTDGLLTGATAVTGTGGSVNRDLVQSLLYGMPPEYRGPGNRLVWLMSTSVLGLVARIETSGGGNAVYPNANLNQSVPVTDESVTSFGSVEGIPVLEFNDADLGAIPILANMDYFSALLDDSIRVETTTEGGDNFTNDTQQWKFVQRQDGAVTNAAAIVKASADWTA